LFELITESKNVQASNGHSNAQQLFKLPPHEQPPTKIFLFYPGTPRQVNLSSNQSYEDGSTSSLKSFDPDLYELYAKEGYKRFDPFGSPANLSPTKGKGPMKSTTINVRQAKKEVEITPAQIAVETCYY